MTKRLPIGPSVDSFESIGKPVGEARKEFKSGLRNVQNEFFSQLLGFSLGGEKKSSNEAQTAHISRPRGEIYNINDLKQSADRGLTKADKSPTQLRAKEKLVAKPERRAAAIEYFNYHKEIVNSGKEASRNEMQTMNERIQQIKTELQKLIASSKELQGEFGKFTVQQAPQNPGSYYISFFEWLLVTIRTAREKVENSRAWMNTVKGKNGKKVDYWDLYKQNGTSYGLSNERAIAIQTG